MTKATTYIEYLQFASIELNVIEAPARAGKTFKLASVIDAAVKDGRRVAIAFKSGSITFDECLGRELLRHGWQRPPARGYVQNLHGMKVPLIDLSIKYSRERSRGFGVFDAVFIDDGELWTLADIAFLRRRATAIYAAVLDA